MCDIKNTDSGLAPKARLVTRGFEEPENDTRKESPACSKDSLRVIGSEDKKELFSVTESDCLLYKIGQLLWVTGQTRPDTSYKTC